MAAQFCHFLKKIGVKAQAEMRTSGLFEPNDEFNGLRLLRQTVISLGLGALLVSQVDFVRLSSY